MYKRQVRLSADNRIVDLDHEDIDLALRYVSPDNAPSGSVLLFEEEVFPVAAPELAARLPATLRPEDLAQVSLLAFEHGHQAPWLSWDPWLAGMGLANALPKAVMPVSYTHLDVYKRQDCKDRTYPTY